MMVPALSGMYFREPYWRDVVVFGFVITNVRSQLASKQNPWHFFFLQGYIIALATCKTWSAETTHCIDQQPAICEHMLAHERVSPPPADTLGNLLGPLVTSCSSAWKFCLGGGEFVVFIVIKTRGYLNLILACDFSKTTLFWQSGWQISSLAEHNTHSFPGVFFSLLNLSSVPFLPAYSKANSFRPQNLASWISAIIRIFPSFCEHLAMKRPWEVDTVPVFGLFLRVDSCMLKVFSDWHLTFCSF